MRRFLISTGTALLAAAVLMGGSPAQAGSFSWADPETDPSTLAQGTLDITKVSLNFDGKDFVSTLDLKQVGDPAPFGTGQYYAFRFFFGENEYILRLTVDRLNGEGFQFQQRTQTPGGSEVAAITCKTCRYKVDKEASKVTLQIGFESLRSAARKLAPGGKIENMSASTGAAYSEPSGTFGTLLWAGTTAAGDSAPAPDGATFTF